jgi:hypothetical protein
MTTTWGLRLTASMVYKAYQKGEDGKYTILRKEKVREKKNYWLWTYPNIFLQYAVHQALVCIPMTLAFYTTAPTVLRSDVVEYNRDIPASVAVFLFTSGFLLETLSDFSTGVYSIVRNPGSLGDTLCHMAFYVLGIQQPAFYTPGSVRPSEHAASGYHWSRLLWAALGPLSSYLYLRGVERTQYRETARSDRSKGKGVAAKTEADVTLEDEERVRADMERLTGRNAVWPKVKELSNIWFLGILGAGLAGVGVELLIRK